LTSTRLVKDLFDHIDSGNCQVPNIKECTDKVQKWFQAAFPHETDEEEIIGSLHWKVFLNGFGMFFGMYNNFEVNQSQYAKLLSKYGLDGDSNPRTTTATRAARVVSSRKTFTSLSAYEHEGSGEFDPAVR
jgi:hypothetical protein